MKKFHSFSSTFFLISFCCALSPNAAELAENSNEAKASVNSCLWSSCATKYNITRPINIANGSLLGFADSTIIGDLIRFLSDDEEYGLSHIGMAIVAKPSEILEIVKESIKLGGLADRKDKYAKEQLKIIKEAYPYLKDAEEEISTEEQYDVFCLESVGSAGDVLRGLLPRVQISPLVVSVESYDGNVCVRSLFEPIKFDDLRAEIIKVLGASYEQNILELLGSPWDKNKVKGNDSWFCSELIAYLYNVSQVITEDNFLPNNVIPKEFSTRSNIDFLKGKATEEQWLKIMDSFVDD